MRPLGVWWHTPPENFLYFTLDFDLILGGGGKFKLEGGNPSAPAPLYATLTQTYRLIHSHRQKINVLYYLLKEKLYVYILAQFAQYIYNSLLR